MGWPFCTKTESHQLQQFILASNDNAAYILIQTRCSWAAMEQPLYFNTCPVGSLRIRFTYIWIHENINGRSRCEAASYCWGIRGHPQCWQAKCITWLCKQLMFFDNNNKFCTYSYYFVSYVNFSLSCSGVLKFRLCDNMLLVWMFHSMLFITIDTVCVSFKVLNERTLIVLWLRSFNIIVLFFITN